MKTRLKSAMAAIVFVLCLISALCITSGPAHGSIGINPKFKGWTTAGTPLAGGLLYTYKPGTTTAKSAYTDSTLATPAANPVVLDAYGEASIYFKGTYKLVLKTSTGVTLWTVDNVTGVGGYLQISAADYGGLNAAVTALGATTCELVVDAADALTASVTIPTTMSLKIVKGGVVTTTGFTLTVAGTFDAGPYQVFAGTGTVVLGAGSAAHAYAEWWGVTGTADQAAINKALAATSASRIPVRLLARNYNITGEINYDTGNSLLGSAEDDSSGASGTSIVSTYNGYAVSRLSGYAYSVRIQDLKIILDATSSPAISGINLDQVSSANIERVKVFLMGGSTTGSAFYVARSSGNGGYYHRIVRCMAFASSGTEFAYGFRFGGTSGCNQNLLDNCHASRCKTSVYLNGAHNIVRGLNSEVASDYHVYIGPGTGSGNHTIDSPYMDSLNTSVGIFDSGITGSKVINPHFVDLATNLTGASKMSVVSGNFKPSSLDSTYGATISGLDSSSFEVTRIVATDTNAFVISNPTNAQTGARLVYIILNSSGGTMGAVTWGSDFVLTSALNNPANGKHRIITFRFYGSKWIEESRSIDTPSGPKSGTADPAATSVAVDYIGQIYVKTDTQKVYVAYGTTAGNWVLTN
jgi:hypothetical protein